MGYLGYITGTALAMFAVSAIAARLVFGQIRKTKLRERLIALSIAFFGLTALEVWAAGERGEDADFLSYFCAATLLVAMLLVATLARSIAAKRQR